MRAILIYAEQSSIQLTDGVPGDRRCEFLRSISVGLPGFAPLASLEQAPVSLLITIPLPASLESPLSKTEVVCQPSVCKLLLLQEGHSFLGNTQSP